MKTIKLLALLFLGLTSILLFSACENDDDNPDIPDPVFEFPGDCQLEEYTITSSTSTNITRRAYTYDENGRVLKRDSYTNDTLVSSLLHQWDDMGRMIEVSVENAEGEQTNNTVYEYQPNGDLVLNETIYFESEDPFLIRWYTYEEGSSRISKDSAYYFDTDFSRVSLYEYNDAANQRTVTTYRDGEYEEREVINFDPAMDYPFSTTSVYYFNLPNAVLSFSSYDENDQIEDGSSYSVVYAMDKEAREMTMTYNYLSGRVSEFVLSYDQCE
jgi:YD repeat-containing protein